MKPACNIPQGTRTVCYPTGIFPECQYRASIQFSIDLHFSTLVLLPPPLHSCEVRHGVYGYL